MPQKALGEIAEVDFDTSEENQLSYLQNGYFFKNHWGCHEPNNQENAYRKINTNRITFCVLFKSPVFIYKIQSYR